MNEKRMRWIALFWLLLCCGLSALWGVSMLRHSPDLMIDFKGVFYDTRCLLLHSDPYEKGAPLRVYLAEGGKLPPASDAFREILRLDVYPPTTSIFVAPFAMLPWGLAYHLWMIFTAGAFSFAAFLMWDIGAAYAPVVAGGLICFVLANTEAFFTFGNSAGIVVSLCMVAVWCFLQEKLVWAGVLCLAASLAIKPHDAGLVWLYFLLAGGVYRKRALQTLLVSVALVAFALLWIAPIAPHWAQELHSNLLAASVPGGASDPGPANALNGRGPAMIIDLQSFLGVFWNDSRIYNPVSYLVCGALLLVWVVRTLKTQFSRTNAWLALAAAVPVTMLVTYHRTWDAKLLLLTVPACAMLWAEGKLIRWIALLVTAAGMVFTADIPLALLSPFIGGLRVSAAGLPDKILTVLLMRPAPLILLAMGIFYLWIYVRHSSSGVSTAEPGEPGETPLALPRA